MYLGRAPRLAWLAPPRTFTCPCAAWPRTCCARAMHVWVSTPDCLPAAACGGRAVEAPAAAPCNPLWACFVFGSESCPAAQVGWVRGMDRLAIAGAMGDTHTFGGFTIGLWWQQQSGRKAFCPSMNGHHRLAHSGTHCPPALRPNTASAPLTSGPLSTRPPPRACRATGTRAWHRTRRLPTPRQASLPPPELGGQAVGVAGYQWP